MEALLYSQAVYASNLPNPKSPQQCQLPIHAGDINALHSPQSLLPYQKSAQAF
ncbi:Protein of unknown function [Pyronema omphalodes CBS 100304]|uniref:Uncharacterized protein n=1 Tax=Pyronema omphalodes (strain CBS 100304) TaxID=1076935 RepID=U4LW90_PYROM|nr:Protein of unknown function [Pyronema omphalodes CBS 100304]